MGLGCLFPPGDAMTEPWHDTPLCKCVLGDGTVCEGPRTELDHEGLPAGMLRCCACGDDAPATPDEIAQARKADAAYLREVDPEQAARRYGEPPPPPPDDKTLPMFPVVTR